MQRAQRLLRIPPYPFREIASLKKQAISEGVKLIDFGIGDPDQPTPDFVIDALAEAARDPATHQYDETGYGIPEFKEAVAEFMKMRFGVQVSRDDEVQSCLGCKEALVHVAWAYVDPGDIVLVPDPAYCVYKVQATFCSGVPYPMPLKPENGFVPDLETIPPSVANAAKILWLNYPNNPTGAVADLDYYARVIEFARKHELLVCQDAAYSEVAFDGHEPHSILEVEGAKEVAIEFHSFSKTFNMTGWRLGWAVGGAAHVEALSKIKANVDSGTFMAIQRAGAAALKHYPSWVSTMRGIYQERRDRLVDGLHSLGWSLEKPRATFYLWVPIPEGQTSESFARALLVDCGLLVIPGTIYGDYGEGFVRMSLTIQGRDPLAQIDEALERLRTARHLLP